VIGGVAEAAGTAMALFGWSPGQAWAATPRDLIAALAARIALRRLVRPVPAGRADLDNLKAHLGGE